MVTREPPWPIAPPRHLPPDGISIRKSRGVMTNRWTGARAGGLEGWRAGGLDPGDWRTSRTPGAPGLPGPYIMISLIAELIP